MKKIFIVLVAVLFMGCSERMTLNSVQLTEIEPISRYRSLVFTFDGVTDPSNPNDVRKALSDVGIVDYEGVYYYSSGSVYIVFYKEE